MTAPSAEWVLLAHIVRPQGRRGEVLADILTDFPERFSQRKQLFLRPPAGAPSATMRAANVDAHWLHQGRVVLKFSQVDSIDDAESLRGFDLVIPPEERVPLEDDAVYISDLLGITIIDVRDGRNEVVGEIADVEPEGPGPSMLMVRTRAGDEVLIPFVRAYLRKVDLAARRLEMELPEGLVTTQAPLTEQERSDASRLAPDAE